MVQSAALKAWEVEVLYVLAEEAYHIVHPHKIRFTFGNNSVSLCILTVLSNK